MRTIVTLASYVTPVEWLLVIALSSTVFNVEEIRKQVAMWIYGVYTS